jgi:hypothetical protein
VAPSITDTADFLTNASSKTVTIDDVTVSDSANTLTISNLTVAGTGGATNTLFLSNAGTNVPLHVLNAMTITNAAVLQITNSFLQVDGGAGGTFLLTGSMRIFNKAKVQLNKATFSNGALLQFALGTNSSSVVVSNGLTLGGTLNVTDGGGFFTTTNYTLFTYGGVLTYNGLTIGTTPSNVTCSIDTSVTGQVNLVASQLPPPPSGSFQIISIVRSTNDISVTWTASGAGNNFVQATAGDVNGGYSTNNFQDISGQIVVGAGTTNTYPDVGGATNAPSRFYRIRFPQ